MRNITKHKSRNLIEEFRQQKNMADRVPMGALVFNTYPRWPVWISLHLGKYQISWSIIICHLLWNCVKLKHLVGLLDVLRRNVSKVILSLKLMLPHEK